MASSSSAHPSASEAEEPRSPQLHDQTGWGPIPTNLQDWNLRLDEPAWIREGSGSEAALADRSRAEASAAAVRLMMEVEEEEEEEEVVVEEEEEHRRTVPSLGDPNRAAVAAAAVRLMMEVEPSPRPLPPMTRSNPPAAAAPSRRPYLERREREARAELNKRLSDVTPPPEDDDARFRAAAEKIMERQPMLDFDLTCSCCGEELEGRNMLMIVLGLPADLRTDRLMTAATKWLDEHPAPLL